MEYETIKDLMEISRISGLVEGLSTMEGATISKAATIRLEEAADRLASIAFNMSKEDVITNDGPDDGKTKIGFSEIPPCKGSPDQ